MYVCAHVHVRLCVCVCMYWVHVCAHVFMCVSLQCGRQIAELKEEYEDNKKTLEQEAAKLRQVGLEDQKNGAERRGQRRERGVKRGGERKRRAEWEGERKEIAGGGAGNG